MQLAPTSAEKKYKLKLLSVLIMCFMRKNQRLKSCCIDERENSSSVCYDFSKVSFFFLRHNIAPSSSLKELKFVSDSNHLFDDQKDFGLSTI